MAEESSYNSNGTSTTTNTTAIRSVSDLKDPNKRIWIVTTAALPWMTGTAVNPLMRALYLTRGRPQGYVSLVIPWLKDDVQRKSLYGNKFPNQRMDQEQMIRAFCRDRAHCEEEEKKLNIVFYDAEYQTTFGSIFPSVDICSLIPTQEADVAILEEPEHLNWFRVPASASLETPVSTTSTSFASQAGNTLATVPETEDSTVIENNDSSTDDKENDNGNSLEIIDSNNQDCDETMELGWAFKFRHVVGILHTNYEAYVQQYGMAAKYVTAPALHALSSLVVRAHCHKIIRLSATLPSLAEYKEVTCNVHGVRSEFLDRNQKTEEKPPASVYFIGKVIWAKGFESVLELQNSYRAKHGNYFHMDVYGSGPDQKVIQRAFLGRPNNDDDQSSNAQIQESTNNGQHALPRPEPIERTVSSEVFDLSTSLRQHILTGNSSSSLDDFQSTSSTTGNNDVVEPFQVLSDFSQHGLNTGKEVTMAALSVAKTAVRNGLRMTFTKVPKEEEDENNDGQNSKYYYSFDPPLSIHEFRRNPIPARFLGVRDHGELAKIPSYKVFLNMSTSEVLCTTSAEAIAMGKFVILPKHPSNTFFLQFPNCLSYTTPEECLAMLEFAMENEPKPLSDEHMAILSWDGAMERLFESATITVQDWNHWRDNGLLKRDEDAARFHAETAKKGQQITSFLQF